MVLTRRMNYEWPKKLSRICGGIESAALMFSPHLFWLLAWLTPTLTWPKSNGTPIIFVVLRSEISKCSFKFFEQCMYRQTNLFWLSVGSLPHPTATLLQADLRLHRCIHSAGIKGLSGGTEEVWGRRRHTFYVVISLPSFTDASHRWIQSVDRGEQAQSEITACKSAARLICTSARTCIPQELLWGKFLRPSKWSGFFRCFIPEEQWQPGLPKPL